jgi:hypothetical protein
LDAQLADLDEDDATDSTDDDYQPLPRYRSPRPHDHEVGGSGSASRRDPAMVAILERLTLRGGRRFSYRDRLRTTQLHLHRFRLAKTSFRGSN